MIVVPDPSVTLKWVLPRDEEQGRKRARRVLGSFVARELELVVFQL